MAEESKIVVSYETKGQKGVSESLGSITQQLKAAKAAALNGDGAAAKKVAELKDKIDDLKDSTKSLQGSGVEKVGNSFGLLGEGLANFDFDKVKTGFKGIGAAMSAIPIFLIVEGVRYLITEWDNLSKGNGIIAKSLRAIGEVISWLGDKITQFTDWLGLTNSELEKQGEQFVKNSEAAKAALEAQTKAYDDQMKIAKAAGKSTVEIEKQKQEAIIKTNLEIAKQAQALIVAQVRNGEEVSEEQKKILTDALNNIRNANVQQKVDELNNQKEERDNYKKHLEEKLALFNKSIDDRKKKEQEELDYENYLNTIRLDYEKITGEQKKDIKEAEIIDTFNYEQAKTNIEQYENEKRAALLEKERQEKAKVFQEDLNNSVSAATSIQNLSDTVFAIRMANVKKGSVEEEKAARKQFQINKALQLATAAINGAQAVTAILAVPDFTFGVASALRIAGAVTATAATIAKISATQFQATATSADSSAPTIGNVTSNIQTQAPQTTAQAPQNNTELDQNGNVTSRNGTPIFKTYVLEGDITDAQKNANRYKSRSTFG